MADLTPGTDLTLDLADDDPPVDARVRALEAVDPDLLKPNHLWKRLCGHLLALDPSMAFKRPVVTEWRDLVAEVDKMSRWRGFNQVLRDEARLQALALSRFVQDRDLGHDPILGLVCDVATRKVEYAAFVFETKGGWSIANLTSCQYCWRLTNTVADQRTNFSPMPIGDALTKRFTWPTRAACRIHSVGRGGRRNDYDRAVRFLPEVEKCERLSEHRDPSDHKPGEVPPLAPVRKLASGTDIAAWRAAIPHWFPVLANHATYAQGVLASPVDALTALDDVDYAGREQVHLCLANDAAALAVHLAPMMRRAELCIAIDGRRRHGGPRRRREPSASDSEDVAINNPAPRPT